MKKFGVGLVTGIILMIAMSANSVPDVRDIFPAVEVEGVVHQLAEVGNVLSEGRSAVIVVYVTPSLAVREREALRYARRTYAVLPEPTILPLPQENLPL